MEWKIGEIKQVNGEWYQCVVAIQGCRECSFRAQDYCTRRSECTLTERSDKTSVIFKKLEKVGEPIEFTRGLYFQRYQLADSTPFYEGDTRLFFNAPTKTFVYIEIKVKEDMEENKLKLKPFNLEEAKHGKPVCTRHGKPARIICWDKLGNLPIVALVMGENNKEFVFYYNGNGRDNDTIEKDYDLMMAPERHEGWINVYKGGKLDADCIYPTKADALENVFQPMKDNYIDTIKVEWEE